MFLKKTALVLVDATGTIISPEVLNQFKQVSSQASGKLITKTAILGRSGTRKTFLEIISKFTQNKIIPFDDRQTAMDWLVSKPRSVTGKTDSSGEVIHVPAIYGKLMKVIFLPE